MLRKAKSAEDGVEKMSVLSLSELTLFRIDEPLNSGSSIRNNGSSEGERTSE
jgi:hypothetical protein